MSRAPTLRQKIFNNIILAVLILVVLSSTLCGFFFYQLMQQQVTEKIALIADDVLKALEIQDRVNLILELSLYRAMEKPLEKLQSEYDQSGGPPPAAALTQLHAASDNAFDFGVIDTAGKALYSTGSPDIAVSLTRNKSADSMLNNVKKYPSIIHSERAETNLNGVFIKRIYQSSHDGRYILAVSATLDKSRYLFETAKMYSFDLQPYITGIMSKSSMITNINIFDNTASPFFLSHSPMDKPLDGKRREMVEQVLHSGSPASVEIGNLLYHYVYFHPYDPHHQGYAGKVVEVVIDPLAFHEVLLKAFSFSLLIALVSLFFALLAGYAFTRKLVSPIASVTQAVQQIAAGDLSMPLDSSGKIHEMNVLAQSVENMRSKLLAQFDELEMRNRELTMSYQLTIQAFFHTLEHQEKYTADHSLGVNRLSMAIGREMELSLQELQDLEWGSLLHDIGKLVIGNEILLKPGKLTDTEFATIRRHPSVGYDVLPKLPFFRRVGEIVRYHHERFDGKGYPSGLIGAKIPLLARVCAVADALHAMISNRPYRPACQLEEALKEIERCRGTQFDPHIVDALLSAYKKGKIRAT